MQVASTSKPTQIQLELQVTRSFLLTSYGPVWGQLNVCDRDDRLVCTSLSTDISAIVFVTLLPTSVEALKDTSALTILAFDRLGGHVSPCDW